MKISSPAFGPNQMIPKKYTCQGEDINPPLVVEDIPDGTKSLVLIVDDPDAPMGTWVHWVVYNIPLNKRNRLEIKENSIPGVQGRNDFGKFGYGGPCPPSGTHRYFFKIYAVSALWQFKKAPSKEDMEGSMEGSILERVELIGFYKKY